ncbi:MAG TPA: hypothetical protein ENI51_00210 [Candidatus Atribacteria bacterium]|nr:hypothetical protein [Candidatus Atribacteria bacterium]
MELTPVGFFVVLFLTPFLLLRLNLFRITKIAIFCFPLSSVGIFIYYPFPTVTISLNQYMALLLIISTTLVSILHKYKSPSLPKPLVVFSYLFVCAIILSWIPCILEWPIKFWQWQSVTPTGLYYPSWYQEYVHFSVYNLKIIYLFFSMAFFVALYKVLPLLNTRSISRIFIGSCLTMAIFGFLDLTPAASFLGFLAKHGRDVPSSPFHRIEILTPIGIPRIRGIVGEPSNLAELLLIGIGFLIVKYIRRQYVFNHKIDTGIMATFIIATFLTSSSFVLTLPIIIGYALITSTKPNIKDILRIFIIIFSLIFISFTINLIIGKSFFDVMFKTTLLKLGFSESPNTSSYFVTSLHAQWETFKQSPIIGVGWGTENLPIGFMVLLTNVGILGTSIFFILLFLVWKICRKKIQITRSDEEKTFRKGIMLAFLVFLVISFSRRGFAWTLNPVGWFLAAAMVSDYKNSIGPIKEKRKILSNENSLPGSKTGL